MKLKPWYDVAKPREDLREGKPLDASEFAVHLDKVRLGTAPKDYKDPVRFFDRTYLTQPLLSISSEVVRRLSGITTETSAVYNMTTQFGGGKTHALTILYHLAKGGVAGDGWRGVSKILEKAQIKTLPDNCAIAVFVGTEFDSVTGRGGTDGTPLRKTPWGEIAFQLGGKESFDVVAKHDAEIIEPKGDVIEQFLPKDRPCLILMDEVLNYVSTVRHLGYHNKLYNFMQALSETIRGRTNAVLVGSIPASELSYTAADEQDQQRIKNLLDRVGKAVIMSVESESSEIIRRRLFEWDERAVTPDGRVLLAKEAHDTCKAYADWVQDNRQQLPGLINPDIAREQFLATYPFHPMVVSVFERKWQTLPRFQQTRGVLRLLALWVSRAYQDGYKSAQRDPLITLGTAPMEDPIFRAALFEQLGETKLEAAVTTDIVGKKDAHAVRLDAEATDEIKKARLHRKVATTIFFESNGGQMGAEATEASEPEIRLAVGEPDCNIGNIETALEALTDACYYLTVERTRYKFSLRENLNKRFADRRAAVQHAQIDEELRRDIQKTFTRKEPVEKIFFPTKSSEVSDRPVISFAVGDLSQTMDDQAGTLKIVEQVIRECGQSNRTFKSAVIWMIAESAQPMREEARKLLAWRAIQDDADDLKLDDQQKRQLNEAIQKTKRDLGESIWRAYKNVLLLAKDNSLTTKDLGLVHSSSSEGGPIANALQRLLTDGDVEKGVGPQFLARNWPPAISEWSTKQVRDVFFASPKFPRLLNTESVKDTICRGVEEGLFAYVGKGADGYDPFNFKKSMTPSEVELADDVYLINRATAEEYLKQKAAGVPTPFMPSPAPVPAGGPAPTPTSGPISAPASVSPVPSADTIAGFTWTGDVSPQKWVNFYTKVLSKFATGGGLSLTVTASVTPADGVSRSRADETKAALRELGLSDDLKER
jgi:predicted AAA+ superfamily ATPase